MRKVNLKTLQLKSYNRTLLQKVSALKTSYLLCFMAAFGRVESITGETGFGNNEIAIQMKSDAKAKDIIMNEESSKDAYNSSQYAVQRLSKLDSKAPSNQSLDIVQSELPASSKSSNIEKPAPNVEQPSNLLGYEDGSYDGDYKDDHLYIF